MHGMTMARTRLWIEFGLLFVVAPVVMAVFFPADWLFPALFALTVVGLGLLRYDSGHFGDDLRLVLPVIGGFCLLLGARYFLPLNVALLFMVMLFGAGAYFLRRYFKDFTPSWWDKIKLDARRISWPFVAVFALTTCATCAAVMITTAPESLFGLVRQNPFILIAIMIFYPIFSALPQELIFRTLFFERYGGLLPQSAMSAITINAALFSLAHLMFWNVIVLLMTLCGGLAFAYSYRMRGNFLEAVLTHSIAGGILFAFGMGIYFYSGNVVRPF